MHQRKQAHKQQRLCDPVAQRNEQAALNRRVMGSIPIGVTREGNHGKGMLFLRLLRMRVRFMPDRHPPSPRTPQGMPQELHLLASPGEKMIFKCCAGTTCTCQAWCTCKCTNCKCRRKQ